MRGSAIKLALVLVCIVASPASAANNVYKQIEPLRLEFLSTN